MGAEEERAMATIIALVKATDMVTVTEMEMATAMAKGDGTLMAMTMAKATKMAKYMETVKGTVPETDMGRGGGRMSNIFFYLNMHWSTIMLTSIIVKQQLNYPNIKSVLSSFKVASLR
jgi:hypothetical protein